MSGLAEIVITGPTATENHHVEKRWIKRKLWPVWILPIPSGSGGRVGIFSQVFADIGDEQSIEQSLIDMLSHMTNIVAIFVKWIPPSLILLDELGLEPDLEGAGLAIAILRRPALTRD